MKKILKHSASAVLCAGLLMYSAANASADIIKNEPNYPMYGNICGSVKITSEINRDVQVQISQVTNEGNYIYYNTVIPRCDGSVTPNTYYFDVEGKNDASYSIKLTASKYAGTEVYQSYETSFTVADTDYAEDNTVKGYSIDFSIKKDDSLAVPALTKGKAVFTDAESIYHTSSEVGFPLPEIAIGDINSDSQIDVFDAIAVAQYTVGKNTLTDLQLLAADFNQDGKVDVFDAIAIAKETVK